MTILVDPPIMDMEEAWLLRLLRDSGLERDMLDLKLLPLQEGRALPCHYRGTHLLDLEIPVLDNIKLNYQQFQHPQLQLRELP